MKILYRFIIICLPVLFIAPFVIISFYNHPALDDWWYAEVYKQYGMWGAQEHWYMNYTGRFASNFIMTLEPLSFGWIAGHKLTPIFYLSGLYGTIVYAAKNIFIGIETNKYLLSAWIMLTYLLIQRDYFESIYWLSANTLYQVTFLLTIFLFHFASQN